MATISQHNIEAKIDLFKETRHKFLSKINDPKIVTERFKKDIIKLVIDEVVIEGESVKIFATIPLPNKIHPVREKSLQATEVAPTGAAFSNGVNQTKMERIWTKHKQLNTTLKPKVFVAMSGGVDSSVAAALLLREGYDVTGVHMRCWPGMAEECAKRDLEDARSVADTIGISFLVWNFEKEYKQKVVDYMIDGYKKGITPNPDVMCNREIKFGIFFEKALASGADFVATGHYVRLRRTQLTTDKKQLTSKQGGGQVSGVRCQVFAARDLNKDQSYFLWTLTQRQLQYCLFPIGEHTKPEVRALAKKFGLPTAEKKDSQGICFMGPVTLDEFLEKYIPQKKGKVITTSGRVIGEHKGLNFYTIGQRHGLNLSDKRLATNEKENTKAHYVAKKDAATNTIVVAEEDETHALSRKEIELMDVNFVCDGQWSMVNGQMLVYTRVRYRQPLQKATLLFFHSVELQNNVRAKIIFDEPVKFIAAGQSVVFYMSTGEMVGGGIIESTVL